METDERTVEFHSVVACTVTYRYNDDDTVTIVDMSAPYPTDGGELWEHAREGAFEPDASEWVYDTPWEVQGPALDRAVADCTAMDAIAKLLSGQEWDSDTTDAIARLVRGTGRPILDVEP